jgi:anti-sigma factor RsiW
VNTEDTTAREERLWAFLHGELKRGPRRAFEREAAADPELRKRLAESRRMERVLRVALRQTAPAEEEGDRLVTAAVRSWEAEAPRAARRRGVTGWMTFSIRAAAGVGSLAAALYVLLLPAFRYSDTPVWTRPSFEPLVLRGTEQREPGVKALTRYEVKRCQIALNAALRTALAQRSDVLPAGLEFSMRVRELRGGALSVTVHAKAGPRTVGDWTGQYSGVDAFLRQAGSSAENMIQDLVRKGDAGGA